MNKGVLVLDEKKVRIKYHFMEVINSLDLFENKFLQSYLYIDGDLVYR